MSAEKRPNIVLIYIDDMGWRDLGCYGSAFYESPTIDQLCAEGMAFSQAYASCPVCSPSRASILTGKYPVRLGVTNYIDWSGVGPFAHPNRGRLVDAPYVKALPHSETSLAQALKEGGYATWHVGKWHLGGEGSYPTDHGFDQNIGGCEWGMPCNGYFSPWGIKNLPDQEEGTYLTDYLTDESIRLIRQHRAEGNENPFYLNLWHYAVHIPVEGRPEDVAHFTAKAKRMHLDETNPIVEGEYFPAEHKKNLRVTRRLFQSDPRYAAMILDLDRNVKRLLDALEEMGETDDTIVIFTSDNGGASTSEGAPTCNIPLAEGKGWMYDGGVRVPLIVKWPGHIQPKTWSDFVTTTPDLYPTLLDMAGLPLRPEQHADGISILPVLQRNGTPDREAVYWHYPHYGNQGGTPGCSVRWRNYKLIEFFEDGNLELYDLNKDLSEANDLSGQMPELTQKLYRMLCDWKRDVDAKIPEPNPGYIPGGV